MKRDNKLISEIIVEKKREHLDLSTNEFCKWLGVSRPTYDSVRKGKAIFLKTAKLLITKLEITDTKVIDNINIKYYN